MSTVPTLVAPARPAITERGATVFTHEPRPAHSPTSEPAAWQRRYGANRDSAYEGVESLDNGMAVVEVFRDSGKNEAELRVVLNPGTGSNMHIKALLSATALRELARRLIDAAHDIEAHPADRFARQEAA